MRRGLLTRRETAEITGASLSAINKAIEQRVVPVHREGRQPLLDADGLALIAIFDRSGVRLPIAVKRDVLEWVVGEKPYRKRSKAELVVRGGTLIVRCTEEVCELTRVGERYVQDRDRYIASDPEILGGWPVVGGTRMLVETVAKRIDAGDTFGGLRAEFPMIPMGAFEAAYRYAKSNPRRGRPRNRGGRSEPRELPWSRV